MKQSSITYLLTISLAIPAALAQPLLSQPKSAISQVAITSMSTISHQAPKFIENQGQWDSQAKFYLSLPEASIWITTEGMRFELTRPINSSAPAPSTGISDNLASRLFDPISSSILAKDQPEPLVFATHFEGANTLATIHAENQLTTKYNYFIGSDPANWQTNVSAYSAVTFQNIYSEIDLRYFHNGQNFEYEFIAKAGADLSQIKTRYENIESLSINSAGDLEVHSTTGLILRELSPMLYQNIDGHKIEMRGAFKILPNQTFTILPPATYDKSQALTIDPVIVFNTSSNSATQGAAITNSGNAISSNGGRRFTRDQAGDFYITGSITEISFPPISGSSATFISDAFLNKYSGVDFSMIYSAVLGGTRHDTTKYSGRDESWAIAADPSGAAYITGLTHSPDFPTANAYQDIFPGDNNGLAFISKLSPLGDTLVYSTFFYGSVRPPIPILYTAATSAYDIDVDNSGAVTIVGSTSADFIPLVNPLDATRGGREDAFMTKFSPAGDEITYSTLLGGSDLDVATHLSIDNLGQSVITCFSWSSDFPLLNEIQGANIDVGPNKPDVTITRISADGSTIIHSTYLAGSGYDFPRDMTLGADGSIYLTGLTSSSDFTILNAFEVMPQLRFLTKIDPLGSLQYSTYFKDAGGAVALDVSGNTYVSGDFSDNIDLLSKFSSEGTCLLRQDGLNSSTLEYPKYNIQAVIMGNDGTAFLAGLVTVDPVSSAELFITSIPPTPEFVCGDADNSCRMNISDVVFLIARVFAGGPAPDVPEAADANGDGAINIGDITSMVATIFSAGPAPLCGQTGF